MRGRCTRVHCGQQAAAAAAGARLSPCAAGGAFVGVIGLRRGCVSQLSGEGVRGDAAVAGRGGRVVLHPPWTLRTVWMRSEPLPEGTAAGPAAAEPALRPAEDGPPSGALAAAPAPLLIAWRDVLWAVTADRRG